MYSEYIIITNIVTSLGNLSLTIHSNYKLVILESSTVHDSFDVKICSFKAAATSPAGAVQGNCVGTGKSNQRTRQLSCVHCTLGDFTCRPTVKSMSTKNRLNIMPHAKDAPLSVFLWRNIGFLLVTSGQYKLDQISTHKLTIIILLQM